MLLLEWIVPLLVGAVGLTALARRLGVPYPAFLALGGAGLALMPSGPNFVLEPDLALALFVAPVLLDSAYDASWRDVRANWVSIASLAVAAVLVTTLAVAVVARTFLPDLSWPAAIALGAIVAPPDATAAIALLRQLRLPFRMSTALEGEGLLNDACALFIYRIALGIVAAGGVHAGFLATAFVLVLPLSLAAGVALSKVTSRVIDKIDDPPSSIILQFSFTFGIWMLADRLQLSPVMTIVAYAVAVSRRAARRFGARQRVPSFAVWETATFFLNVLAFVLVGLQLRPILAGMQSERLALSLGFAMAILATCLAARILWVMFYVLVHRRTISRRADQPKPTLRGGLVVSWCGMRGIVTLAAAFALPNGDAGGAFPHRDLMLLTAFVVVLGTLVLQGFTLKPLLRWADLHDDDPVGREIGLARTEVLRAGMAVLEDEHGPMAEKVRQDYAAVLREAEADPDGFAPASTAQDALRLRAIDGGRRRLAEMRRHGTIGSVAYARIEEELDQAEMHASS